MGWKSVKDHYRIQRLVQVRDGNIAIGSGFLPELIVITPDGRLLKRYDGGPTEDLTHIQRAMDGDLATLRRLAAQPDTFAASLVVYTYDGAQIIECRCERLGWPNVTHDGQLMYENTFSSDRDYIVERAKANALAGLELSLRAYAEAERRLHEIHVEIERDRHDLKALGVEVPAALSD